MFALEEENNLADFLDLDSEDIIIQNLVKKYALPEDEGFIDNNNIAYASIIEFITQRYLANQDIPDDIHSEINNNINFQAFLLEHVKEKMNHVINDKSTKIYKEIVTIIHLLSFGKNYEVFENYNYYNYENISTLFRDYEERLVLAQELSELEFKLMFDYYITLIELFNEICTINAIDIQRKRSIKKFIELLSETINMVKYRLKLDEEHIGKLNNIMGKFLFYYSHVPFIEKKNKDAKYLIEEFYFNFEKLSDGYALSQETNFGNCKDITVYYKIYLNNATTLLLTLLYKLEKYYTKEEYDHLVLFKNIKLLYKNMIHHTPKKEFESLDEFRNILLNNYLFIYDETQFKESYFFILNDFMNKKEFNSSNMELIFYIILFSKQCDNTLLISILQLMISFDKYANDYHEYYKLKVCDLIIQKLTQAKSKAIKESLDYEIINYIEQNKTASHLMPMYSKIYLSLAVYYSFFFDKSSQDKVLDCYATYIYINSKEPLEQEFKELNTQLLKNIGKYTVVSLNVQLKAITDENLFEMANHTLQNYFQEDEIRRKYQINQSLVNIISDIYKEDGLNNEKLNRHMEKLISNDIFYGLAKSNISGLKQDEQIQDLGYETVEVALIEDFELHLSYSTIYKKIFSHIFENNQAFIQQNITNILTSYLKSIPLYIDSITHLNNISQLIKSLESYQEEFIFVEIYINNLEMLNKKYSYYKGNSYFKQIATQINDIVPTFRLNGPKVCFILEKGSEYKTIIDSIKKLNGTIEENVYTIEPIIAVTWAEAKTVLEKSSYALESAKSSQEHYFEFE